MKLQKIILGAAIASTSFGASVGLLEIGNYRHAALAPVRIEIKPPLPSSAPPFAAPAAPQNIPDFGPAAAEATEPEAESSDRGENGYYYIIGEQPEGFEDFEYLDLTTHEWSEKKNKYVAVKPYAELQMKKVFNLSWLSLTGRRISFISGERRGVSYQFDGKFIAAKEVKYKSADGAERTDEAVLKGRLTKWRGGRKIAEAKVKLGVHHGC